MGFSKADFEKLDKKIQSIVEQAVEEIEVKSDLPPTIEQLQDNNKTYVIKASILFIDIRKSTHLTENSHAKSMVKIYRSFMRMAVDCVRKNGGVTRQFLGDRIMGVFIDSIDENGVIVQKSVDKAVNSARSLQTAIDYSLNRHLKNSVNGKIVECGIGIDYGKVLVTQVGMYGVENNENKENEVDCVWVGNTTNYASKYSDIALGGEVFISDNVYKQLSEEYKDVWVKSAKYKGSKLFQGYVAKDYYMDYVEELGKPVKIEEDNTVQNDTSTQLAYGIKEVERLQSNLIKREKEIAVLEERLKQENRDLKEKYDKAIQVKNGAITDRGKVAKELCNLRCNYYEFLKEILEKVHCRQYKYMDAIGIEKFEEIIKKLHELGKALGKSIIQVNYELSCYLIGIYNYFKLYDKAFEIMLVMADNSKYWVYLEDETLKWAKEQFRLSELYNVIERGLVNYRVENDKRKDFEGYLQRIREIRGY